MVLPHSFDLQTWQKQSKYRLLTHVAKVLYIQETKNQSLLADFPILQTHLPIGWSGEWRRWFALISPTPAILQVIAGKFSAKHHGRFRFYLWIQYGPCITILSLLILVYSMFHLHPQKSEIEWAIENTEKKKWKL